MSDSNKYLLAIVLTLLTAFSSCLANAQDALNLRIPPTQELSVKSITDLPLVINSNANATTALYIKAVSQKVLHAIQTLPKSGTNYYIFGEAAMIITIAEDGSLSEVYSPYAFTTGDKSQLVETFINAAKYAAPFSPPPQTIIQNHKSVKFSRFFRVEKRRYPG